MTHRHPVSSQDCVAALLLEGFEFVERRPGSVALVRGSHSVVVPDEAVLRPSTLHCILAQSALSYDHLLELLGEELTSLDIVVEGA